MPPQEETKQSSLSVPIAIILAGGLIAAAVYFSNNSGSNIIAGNNQGVPQAQEINLREVSSNDHIIGNPNADVVFVEYSDTECPFCKNFHQTMKQVVQNYDSDEVAWVYRHFPIDQLHQKARKEAEATECAYEQGGHQAFWRYIDRVFEITPSNDGLDEQELYNIAEAQGLDIDKFTSCLEEGRMASKVQADYEDALASGARGTPHSVILVDGGDEKIPLQGAQPYDIVKQTIDSLLE